MGEMCSEQSLYNSYRAYNKHHRNRVVYTQSKKRQVYSRVSVMKTHQPILHFIPWSLDLFIRVPFQLHGEHTVLQRFRRIELIVHTVLPGIHLHLSQVEHVMLKYLA